MATQPRTAPAPRFYDDHDPEFLWVHREESDTLLVHLPEYKREHLKVQVDGHGNLSTGGERPTDGNRWTRFLKDFRLPENCNSNGIRAKFENETLYVHLPKLITPADAQDRRPAPTTEPKPGRDGHDKSQKTETGDAKGTRKPNSKDAERAEEKNQGNAQNTGTTDHGKRVVADHDHKVDGGNKTEQSQEQQVCEGSNGGNEVFHESDSRYDIGGSGMGLRKQGKRLVLNVAVAVIVLVVLGVYIYYRN